MRVQSVVLQVSTAVRLCDGAIVLVDAVEGVCPQVRGHTHYGNCCLFYGSLSLSHTHLSLSLSLSAETHCVAKGIDKIDETSV